MSARSANGKAAIGVVTTRAIDGPVGTRHMKSKKNKDLVAGRLNGASTVDSKSASEAAKRNTNYGTDRLGILSETDAKPAEQLRRQPRQEEQAPKSKAAPVRQSKPAPPTKVVVQSAPAPASTCPPAEQTHLKARLAQIAKFCQDRRPAVMIAGGLAGIVLAAVLWIALSTDDKPLGPKRASAADNTAVAKANPAPTEPTKQQARAKAIAQAAPAPKPSKTRPPRLMGKPLTKAARPSAAKQATVKTTTPLHKRILSIFQVGPLSASAATAGQTPASGPGAGELIRKAQSTSRPAAAAQPAVRRYIACPPGFKLAGVMSMPSGRFANINGKYTAVGETVNGAKVIEIKQFSVDMELKGDRFYLGVGSKAAQASK